LSKFPEYDPLKDGNPFKWIIEQSKVVRAQLQYQRIESRVRLRAMIEAKQAEAKKKRRTSE